MSGVRSHIAVVQDLDGNRLPTPNEKSDGVKSQETYQTMRANLIRAEKEQRFDAEKMRSLTDTEKKANAVVERLKKREEADVYSKEGDLGAIIGMDWEGAKERGVKEGELYKIVAEMPKGAILHCHMDATVDAKWVIARALQEPNLHMLSSAPLFTRTSLYTSTILFRLLAAEGSVESDQGYARADASSPSTQDIFSETYLPNTWVPLHPLRARFPHGNVYHPAPPGYEEDLSCYGDSTSPKVAFDAYIHSLITLTPVPIDYSPPIRTSKQAWKKFLSTFTIIAGLAQNETILRDYLKKSFATFIEDKVTYVEARINFFTEKFVDVHGHPTITHSDLMKIFQSTLSDVQSQLPLGTTFDAKVIYSTVRIIDNEGVRWYIEDAISLKQEFPDLLVGFDLVGHEDPGVTLREYTPELLRMKQRVADLHLDLPLVLHAGETTSDGDETDDNLFDAILLGTKRIGHGFSLIRHPLLIEMVKERKICVESCPISNQLLRFTNATSAHPVLSLLARNVPISISNDDPTQFQNPGLTPDFYQLLSASHHFTLASLGVLARNSITHSLLKEEQKNMTLAKWDQDWAAFVEKVAAAA
ncbi:hypothetical protein CBS101457_004673 [Exobasidium rhododendri]|nr:hypothetical protein CBS101457_004673 [Exobasidium rhododendri]